MRLLGCANTSGDRLHAQGLYSFVRLNRKEICRECEEIAGCGERFRRAKQHCERVNLSIWNHFNGLEVVVPATEVKYGLFRCLRSIYTQLQLGNSVESAVTIENWSPVVRKSVPFERSCDPALWLSRCP